MASVALARSAVPRKLRIGVFLDSPAQPRWVVEAFAKVAACDFAEVAVIGIAGQATRPAAPWPWRLYGALDRRVFGAAADPDERLELARFVPHQQKIAVEGAPAELVSLDLDVAFAVGGLDDAQLDGIARYGVWRFHADGVQEVLDRAPLTASALLARLSPGAEPRIAYQSWSRTYPLSVARNRDALLAKTAEFPLRALREAHRYGLAWLEQCRILAEQAPGRTARAIAPLASRLAAHAWERSLYREQWQLAFRFGGDCALPAGLEGFTRIVPPAGRTWADPFPIERDGRWFVFFEDLPFDKGRAHISVIEVGRDGRWSQPRAVLERDYHLSYPFLFELEGRLYMIPETAQNRTVEAYRCVEFPGRWELERVLVDGVRLADATLHRGADRWWMFANGAPGASRVFDDELHIFHAEHPLGEWRAHARNPVKSDARCARPAGRLYWRGGALYRPAQVCAPSYGAGIAIHRVLRLSPMEYAERVVERIFPAADGLLGLHTVNRAGELTVVDVLARRRRIA